MSLLAFFTRRRPKRVELRYLTYAEADRLIRETRGAWTIAPEEDTNACLGMVYLELLARPAGTEPTP